MKSRSSFGWFLFGLGLQLQIIASLSFTELFVFAAAPVLYFKELPYLKRNGIMPFFWLSLAVFLGCVVSCVANHTEFIFVLRGLAVTSLLPCSVVVGHWMLRKDMNGFKWMLIGGAVSNILSTFFFQKSVEIAQLAEGQTGEAAVDLIMAGPIFWVGRLYGLITAYPTGWYLQCPTIIAVLAPLFMAGFSILTTISGRSATLGAFASAILVLIGGKTRESIRKRVCQRFWMLMCLSVLGVWVAKYSYQTAASAGWLGEESRKKYEYQTRGDKSLKAILLGGRMESFCGLIACVDKPIIGFGPWPRDEYGYIEEFLQKYANVEDYMAYLEDRAKALMQGNTSPRMIPAHAYITEFWLWYGIFGLVFWLYVIFILLRYLRQDCWSVPQWFMWLAASIPSYLWGVFFSPWSARVGGIVFVVACLMARAVRFGRQLMPNDMLKEIQKMERL